MRVSDRKGERVLIREMCVIIDCQVAGISGDMLLSALIDLGANEREVVEGITTVGNLLKNCKKVQASVSEVDRKGFRAKKIDVVTGVRMGQEPTQLLDSIASAVRELKLSKRASKIASGSIRTILEAEAKIHRKRVEEVHLNETGSVDTLADVIGVVVALEDLKLLDGHTKFYSTPVAVGGGTFEFSHGLVSSPAPATLEILKSRNFPIVGGPTAVELTTPTGAALLVNLVDVMARFYPPMRLRAVGYGAGDRDLKEVPNVLRVVLGERLDHSLSTDEICVVETNVDDVTGEVIGHVFDRLISHGARDVSIIPMFTKKSRPGYVIQVIAEKEDAESLSRLLMSETGTLGVRILPCLRYVLQREIIQIKVKVGGIQREVRVKVARDLEGKIVKIKPEYDDVKKLADMTNRPLNELSQMVVKKAREVFRQKIGSI